MPAMSCANANCRRGGVCQQQWFCRCGTSFCSEACFIQAWHSGHSVNCSAAAEINRALADAVDTHPRNGARPARRPARGAAQVAAVALSRTAPEAPTAPISSTGARVDDVEPIVTSSSSERFSSGHIEQRAAFWQLADFKDWTAVGVGSYGSVFRVVHKSNREVFAMKSVSKQFIIEQSMEEYLQREIETQKCLRHPNILRMYAHFDDESQVHLLLEIAEEGNLFSYMRKHKTLSEAVAIHFFGHVVSALAYLHKHNVIHRDLKPENILLCKGLVGNDLVAKLADFGWCAVLPGKGGMRHTFCGTMDYLSPEMVACLPHDHRIDVWACGVLLYEMLAARPPFAAKSQHDAMQRIMKCDLEIPEWFSLPSADVVRSLLQLHPEKRPQLKDVLQHELFQVSPEVNPRIDSHQPLANPHLSLSTSTDIYSPLPAAPTANSDRSSCGSLDRASTSAGARSQSDPNDTPTSLQRTPSSGLGIDLSPSGSSSTSSSISRQDPHTANNFIDASAKCRTSDFTTRVPSPCRSRSVQAQCQEHIIQDEASIQLQGYGRIPETSSEESLYHKLYKRSPGKESPIAYCMDEPRNVGDPFKTDGHQQSSRLQNCMDSRNLGYTGAFVQQKTQQREVAQDHPLAARPVRMGGPPVAVPQINFGLSDEHFDRPRKTGHILASAFVPAGSLDSMFTPRSLEPHREGGLDSVFTPRSLEVQRGSGPLSRCMRPLRESQAQHEPQQAPYPHLASGSCQRSKAASPDSMWQPGLLDHSYSGVGLDHLRFKKHEEQPMMPQTARGKLESTELWSQTETYAKVRAYVRAQQERMTLGRSLDLLIEEDEEEGEDRDISPRKPKSPMRSRTNGAGPLPKANGAGPLPMTNGKQLKRRVSAPGSSILGSANDE